MTPLDLVEILGKKTKEGISDKIAETLIVQSHAIKGIGPSPQGSEKKKKKTDRGEVRSANKQLLGKLHTDHQYLESLLKNPLLTKKYRGTEGLNTIPKKVKKSDFLNSLLRGHCHNLLWHSGSKNRQFFSDHAMCFRRLGIFRRTKGLLATTKTRVR